MAVLAAALVVLVAAALAVPAAAQCPMCGKAAEYAGDGGPGSGWRTLLTAALILLVPSVGFLLGGLALVWRFRRADGQYAAGSARQL